MHAINARINSGTGNAARSPTNQWGLVTFMIYFQFKNFPKKKNTFAAGSLNYSLPSGWLTTINHHYHHCRRHHHHHLIHHHNHHCRCHSRYHDWNVGIIIIIVIAICHHSTQLLNLWLKMLDLKWMPNFELLVLIHYFNDILVSKYLH